MSAENTGVELSVFQKEFSLDNLKYLDSGLISKAFQREVRKMLEDLDQRPSLNKPRVLSLNFYLTPIAGDHGELDKVDMQTDVSAKYPKRTTRKYAMKANVEDQKITFHPDLPDMPGQRSIMDVAGDNK